MVVGMAQKRPSIGTEASSKMIQTSYEKVKVNPINGFL